MAAKNIDWANLGFGYMKTDYRYVSNYKNGSWDQGALTTDDQILLNECACVFQYAQTCFEGLKAYTTEDGHMNELAGKYAGMTLMDCRKAAISSPSAPT